jgi:hypothetical protein
MQSRDAVPTDVWNEIISIPKDVLTPKFRASVSADARIAAELGKEFTKTKLSQEEIEELVYSVWPS